MSDYPWVGWTIGVAGLCWWVFVYWRSTQPHIAVRCIVYLNPAPTEPIEDPHSWPPTKMVKFSVTNTGSIPVSIMNMEVSFKQRNSSNNNSVVKLLSNPICLQPKEVHDVDYRLRDLMLHSLNMTSYEKPCDIETIYVADSFENTWKVHSAEVEEINRRLSEVIPSSGG